MKKAKSKSNLEVGMTVFLRYGGTYHEYVVASLDYWYTLVEDKPANEVRTLSTPLNRLQVNLGHYGIADISHIYVKMDQ